MTFICGFTIWLESIDYGGKGGPRPESKIQVLVHIFFLLICYHLINYFIPWGLSFLIWKWEESCYLSWQHKRGLWRQMGELVRKQSGGIRAALPNVVRVSLSTRLLKSHWYLAGERRYREGGCQKAVHSFRNGTRIFVLPPERAKPLNSSETFTAIHSKTWGDMSCTCFTQNIK